MDALLSLIPGGGFTAIGAAIVAVLAAVWRIFAAGKASGRNQAKAKEVDHYEDEMDRIGNAAEARVAAERRARAGELHDEWTRPD